MKLSFLLFILIEKSIHIQVSYSSSHRENNMVPQQDAILNANNTLNKAIVHSHPPTTGIKDKQTNYY